MHDSGSISITTGMIYQFSNYNLEFKLDAAIIEKENGIKCQIPLNILVNRLTIINLRLVAAVHGI
jgi:hypothetical protein